MTPHLLGLSDDILLRIAYFTNQDHSIPLPSFRPYWANFAAQVSAGNQRDLLALRATCKRLYGLCDLKNLHRKISQLVIMCYWANNCPEKIRKGISRLRLSCADSGRISAPIVWVSLTATLSLLTSLEELILVDLCQFDGFLDDQPNKALLAPSFSVLPSIRSLDISIASTEHSSTTTNHLIISLAPQIQYLRLALHFKETEQQLQEISDMWCTRNKQINIPLKIFTLAYHFSYPYEEYRLTSSITRTIDLFPSHESLTITCFTRHEDMFCMLKSNKDRKNMAGTFIEHESPFLGCFSALPPIHNLKHLDWGILIEVGTKRPTMLSPQIGQNEQDFRQQLGNINSKRVLKKHIAECIASMTVVAQTMLDRMPSLESGVFWEWCKEGWYRWSWCTKIDGQGNAVPVIDEEPLFLEEGFVKFRIDRR